MKWCYTDYIFTILDYFSVIRKGEFVFEWITPLFVAAATYCFSQSHLHLTEDVIKSFVSVLTNVFAILVGFTIAAIAIFTTADYEKNEILAKQSGRQIQGKGISYFRFVYINLIFSSVIGLLMLVLCLVVFLLTPCLKEDVILSVLIFGALLNILLALRNTTNLYFIFFRP